MLTAIDPFAQQAKGATETVKKMTTVLREGDWFEKVAKGKELEELDFQFWTTLLIGDQENGIKGLSTILVEEGIQWQKVSEDDKVSDFIADVLKSADTKDAEEFISLFEKVTGNPMKDLSEQVADGGMDAFANTFAKKMSDSGVLFNAASQIARLSGADSTDDVLKNMKLGDILPESLMGPNLRGEQLEPGWFTSVFGGGFDRFQNNTIRMLVSSPSTTALNVKGWAAATTLNTLSDTMIAGMYGAKAAAQAGLGLFTRDMTNAKQSADVVKNLAAVHLNKVRSILDPNTTMDAFKAVALARPNSMGVLTETLAGGIDDLSKIRKDQGFDPGMTVGGRGQEAFVEAVQKGALVTFQDSATKAVEFMSQLDRALRLKSGVKLRDVLKSPDVRKFMLTEDYAKAEAKALYETQRAIFSKGYGGPKGLPAILKVVEDARNIPVVGIMIPFGRFFNNTLAAMADVSGVTLASKMMSSNYIPDRTFGEVATRTAVGWGIIYSMIDDETDRRDRGMGWSERADPRTGDIIDDRYNFPWSMIKAASRLATYYKDASDLPPEEELRDIGAVARMYRQVRNAFMEDKEIPDGLVSTMGKDVLGQLSRQLVDSSDDFLILVENTLSGDVRPEEWGAMLMKGPAQMASSWTRWLEPFDMAVGMARGVDFNTMDRKQGNQTLNKVMRYTSNLSSLLTGNDDFEKRHTMASGTVTSDPTKFVGQRSGGILTPIEKVANLVGVPTWKLDTIAADPKADNRFNQLGNSYLNKAAKELWDSEAFQKSDKVTRKLLYNKMINETTQFVKDFMSDRLEETGDPRLILSWKISNSTYSKSAIDRGVETVGNGVTDIGDLSYGQLSLLESLLSTEKEMRLEAVE